MVNHLPDAWSEGWPEEPENEDLRQFAGELLEQRPTLPDASLRRVDEVLQSELQTLSTRQRRWKWYRGAGHVAAALLGLGVCYVLFAVGGGERQVAGKRSPPGQETPLAPVVQERFVVEVVTAGVPALPERPLLRVEDNQSLFTSGN